MKFSSSWWGIRVIRVKMTEKWGEIQRKLDLVRAIRVRVIGVLLYFFKKEESPLVKTLITQCLFILT